MGEVHQISINQIQWLVTQCEITSLVRLIFLEKEEIT